MRRFYVAGLTIALVACGTDDATRLDTDTSVRAGVPIPIVEDNVFHDTLLIHNTYGLDDGSFIMSAQNNEENFEGLRLYHYVLQEDGTPDILNYSAPAYDSWMMLPSFFHHPDGGYLILAEFGSTQSWGQKVFHFTDTGFTDLGFLDVAINKIRHFPELDSTYIAKASIAPFVDINFTDHSLPITFTCDSVFVYDNLKGQLDTVYLSQSISYKLEEGKFSIQTH
jgi:hypothetical protein